MIIRNVSLGVAIAALASSLGGTVSGYVFDVLAIDTANTVIIISLAVFLFSMILYLDGPKEDIQTPYQWSSSERPQDFRSKVVEQMGCVQKPQEELRSSGPESMKSVQSRILDEVGYEPRLVRPRR